MNAPLFDVPNIVAMKESSTSSRARRTSLLTIGSQVDDLCCVREMLGLDAGCVQALLDAYLCLFHLTSGIMMEALFQAFVTVSFFEFAIFSVFEMR